MKRNGQLIGQNMFMRTVIDADDGREIPVLTMGPIGITPELQRRGYGKRLPDYSPEKAALTMPETSASAITICRRMRMTRSFSAGRLSRDISAVSLAFTRPRRDTTSATKMLRNLTGVFRLR